VFGGLAREVLPLGNGAFPGGFISDHVLRGPARKGTTTVQRAGGDAPKRAAITSIVLFCSLRILPLRTLLSHAAEHRDRRAQQHSTSPMFPAMPLCWLPCLVIVITADPTLLEAVQAAIAIACFILALQHCYLWSR